MPPVLPGTAISLDGVQLRINGYLRPMIFGETQEYGKLGLEPRERFTAIGVCTKLRMDGRMEDKARFYTEYILDFNEVDQGTDTSSSTSEEGRIKMMKAYVDLYGSSSYLRFGSQIQYWGWFNGFAKPTNRLNASDPSFKNRETNDGKLPDTGVEWVNVFGSHRLALMYVPVSKVNKLSPNQVAFLSFLGYEAETPEANTSNSKYLGRAYGTFGSLDYQSSYIDGLNPRPDLANDGYTVNDVLVIEQADNGRTAYHRYRSPGLDLRYRTAVADWKIGAVYYDTGDSGSDEDPLRQNDWYEWLAGSEIRTEDITFDIHYGQIVIPDLTHESDFDPDDPRRKRIYFQNTLLGQAQSRTHVVTFKYRRAWFGNRLELGQDFEWNWDSDDAPTRFFSRTEVPYFLNDERTISTRIVTNFLQNFEITTREIAAEVQFDY